MPPSDLVLFRSFQTVFSFSIVLFSFSLLPLPPPLAIILFSNNHITTIPRTENGQSFRIWTLVESLSVMVSPLTLPHSSLSLPCDTIFPYLTTSFPAVTPILPLTCVCSILRKVRIKNGKRSALKSSNVK